MSRNVCITAVDGHTGFAIAELLLANKDFNGEIDSVTGLTLHPDSDSAKELAEMGATIVPHKPGRVKDMVKTLQDSSADTLCLIPPADQNKFDLTAELIEAAKKANISNVCFISSVGCDLAERDRQPRLREFIDLESRVLACKGDPSTPLGHSPVVIR